MQKLAQYFRDSWTELTKVTWPTRKQAIKLTAAVLVFSVIFAAYIAVLDTLFSTMLQKLILKV
jgi:preprotein translocase subunit SecE